MSSKNGKIAFYGRFKYMCYTVFFLCLFLSLFTLFCSDEFAFHMIKPYLETRLKNFNIQDKIFPKTDTLTNESLNQQDLKGLLLDMKENMKYIKLFGKVIEENVNMTKSGSGNLTEEKMSAILKALIKSANLSLDMKDVNNQSLAEQPKPARPPIDPKKPFLGKVSEIYTPGFLLSPTKICKNHDTDVKLLIIIHSRPDSFELRQAIRSSWGNFTTQNKIQIAFIVGTSSQEVDTKINEEHSKYDDMIRGKFVDSYNNLTLKTISMLEWTSSNCLKTKYLLKTDDDTFTNVQRVLEVIDAQQNASSKRIIYGNLVEHPKPFRDPNSKYFISVEEYPGEEYPAITTGQCYIITSNCIKDLYENAQDEKFIRLEDVLVTGLVAEKLEVQRVRIDGIINGYIDKICKLKKFINVHPVSSSQHVEYWTSLKNKTLVC